jgi:ABC-type transport system involved in multi-copper enzyme maturation permease subunit
MNRQLGAELLKQRTTRTTIGVVLAMLGVVLVAIALHVFGLSARRLSGGSDQLGMFLDVGENLGAVFAALLGAMIITAEVRHGTIRPTLLVTPQRGRVLAAKAAVAAATGALAGALATTGAAVAGSLFLTVRGVTIQIATTDYILLVAGGAAAAALWALIGLGVGATVRSQVPTIVGLMVWLLFIENILTGSIPTVAKFAPAALGRAIAGATNGTLHNPALAAVLLAAYAGAAFGLGWRATTHRDFA